MSWPVVKWTDKAEMNYRTPRALEIDCACTEQTWTDVEVIHIIA